MGLLLNRAKANTTTTGTGAVTPGSAVSPYQTWSAAGATTGYWYDYLIEDGSAWEGGVGYYNGTTLTRPGSGTDPYFTSSTGSLLSLSGSATIACVANAHTMMAGGKFMPPTAASFSLMSGDATNLTLTDGLDQGLLIDPGAPAFASPNGPLRCAYRTLTTKTSDWNMIVNFGMLMQVSNYANYGLFVRDGTNKLMTLLLQTSDAGGIVVYSFSDLKTYVSTGASYGVPFGYYPTWLRIAQVSNNLIFYASSSGGQWVQISSVSSTSYMAAAPDRVGFLMGYTRSTGSKSDGVIPYFSLTGPAV